MAKEITCDVLINELVKYARFIDNDLSTNQRKVFVTAPYTRFKEHMFQTACIAAETQGLDPSTKGIVKVTLYRSLYQAILDSKAQYERTGKKVEFGFTLSHSRGFSHVTIGDRLELQEKEY